MLNEFLDSNDPNALLFKSLLKLESYKKGDLLHRAGACSNKMYFVMKGLIRVFYYKDGKDISCYFAEEGKITTAIDSFFTNKPSVYSIEVLEDTELYVATNQQMEKLYDEIPEMNRFGRIYITEAYIEHVERFNSIMFRSAQEKYDLFIEKHSHIFQRLSLGQIASYLGMTQETLSRIRAKKL